MFSLLSKITCFIRAIAHIEGNLQVHLIKLLPYRDGGKLFT